MTPFQPQETRPSLRENAAGENAETLVLLALFSFAGAIAWFGTRHVLGATYVHVGIVALLAALFPAFISFLPRHDRSSSEPAIRKPPLHIREWIKSMELPALAHVKDAAFERLLLEEKVTKREGHSRSMSEFGALVFALNVKADTGSDEPLKELAGRATEKVDTGDFVDRWTSFYPNVAKARAGNDASDVEAVAAYVRTCERIGHPLPLQHLRHLADWAPNVWWAILSLDFQDAMIPQGIPNLLAAETALKGQEHGNERRRSVVSKLGEAMLP